MTPGSKLGPYEILAPLGAGGMGEVYRARDTKLGREVAIKVLPAAFPSDPQIGQISRMNPKGACARLAQHRGVWSVHTILESPVERDSGQRGRSHPKGGNNR